MIHPEVAAVMCTIVGTRRASARHTVVHEIVDCVRSILANPYSPLEVIVVDQSPTEVVAEALRPLTVADARLRYVHSDVAGLTHSQNIAVNASDADLFAFTDDDCLVPADWIEQIVALFARHPDAGMAFGEVQPPAGHDWKTTFVPELRVPVEHRLRSSFLPRVHSLLGANMAVRRRTFARIGLFEQGLGAEPFNGEVELALRSAQPACPSTSHRLSRLSTSTARGRRVSRPSACCARIT